jgi:hypothetical protein
MTSPKWNYRPVIGFRFDTGGRRAASKGELPPRKMILEHRRHRYRRRKTK